MIGPRPSVNRLAECDEPRFMISRPRGRLSTFRISDVKRAVKAAQDAGLVVARVEIDGGKILIVAAEPGAAGGRPKRKPVVL